MPQIFREQRASASFDRLADNSLAKFHSLPFAKGEKREAALPGKTDSLKDRQTDRQTEARAPREDINLPRPNVLTHAFLSDVSLTVSPPAPPVPPRILPLCLVFRARVRIYLDSRQGPASLSSADDSRPRARQKGRGDTNDRERERDRERLEEEEILMSAVRGGTASGALAKILLRFKSVRVYPPSFPSPFPHPRPSRSNHRSALEISWRIADKLKGKTLAKLLKDSAREENDGQRPFVERDLFQPRVSWFFH